MQSSLLAMSMPPPPPPPSMYRGVSGSLARFLQPQAQLSPQPLSAEDRFAHAPQPQLQPQPNAQWQQHQPAMQTPQHQPQLHSPVSSPRVRQAPPAIQPPSFDDFSYDPFAAHSVGFLSPATPVPSGRSWLHLSRHPVLHDASMATMRRVEATRDAVVEQARLIGKLKTMTPRAAYILDQIEQRFVQMNVEASQLFLARAQSQSSADEQAMKAGLTVHWPAVPSVPVLARAITAASVKSQPAPAIPASVMDAGIDSVMSASGDLDRVSSVVAAAAPLLLPPPALLISSSIADDCHSLDAEADAEVASMVDVKSARSGSMDSALALVLSAPRFSPRRPLSEDIPPLQLDVQSHETRSVTSGSSDGASSAFTQRASQVPDRASPPTLMPAHASRLVQAALDDSPAAARLRRDNIHSCPIKSKPPKVAAKESAASRIFAPIAEGAKLPPSGINMLRSQSACQRPSASPSPAPSCRRRLNFDAPAAASTLQTKPRVETPYKERLLLNTPLQEWLVAHLDDPFPTADEKQALSKASGLSYDQVQAWFINNRGRSLDALKAKRDATLGLADTADRSITPVKKSKRVHTPQSVAGWVAAVEFHAGAPIGVASSATAVVLEAASSARGADSVSAMSDGVDQAMAPPLLPGIASDVAATFSVGKKSKAAGANKRGKRSRA